jgi:uncharacterized protein (DUF952 family)
MTIEPLYKIVSVEGWEETQGGDRVILSSDDHHFIHFSTKEQLDRIIAKYWSEAEKFVVLKIDTTRLIGRLVYEANVVGGSRYYHLYEGSIPLNSVIEHKLVNRAKIK